MRITGLEGRGKKSIMESTTNRKEVKRICS